MAFVRIITTLIKDKQIGKHIVPIVPDEARTFGMEGMFRQVGIYSSKGQLYTPQDADQLMYYREDKKGQILEEGINEGGAFCSWLARGFLIGGTAGRTTLAGEGLQHQDGHSLLNASTVPNCVSYDPTYAYELAVIIQDGLRRMIGEQENIFYYITCMNENYVQPPMPAGVEDGILKGMYLLQVGGQGQIRVQLMGSGTILREVLAAAKLLNDDFGIPSDIWSVTSFNELRRDALATERWNQLHPEDEPRKSYLDNCLADRNGPYVAATDYMKIVPDQVQRWMPGRYVTLGTDGYGRSDDRDALRQFFEVDERYIAVTALKTLADDGALDQKTVTQAIRKYGIDPDKPDPVTL